MNNLILLFSFFEFVDLLVQSLFISKTSKFLSLGNNINNQKLLLEIFRINEQNNYYEKYKENDLITFFGKEKLDDGNKTFKKFRIIFPEKKDDNGYNTFDNNSNKFREVELIEKIEYKSVGIQTDEDYDTNIIKNDSSLLDGKIIEEDFSKNIILVKNKSLINSFSTNN